MSRDVISACRISARRARTSSRSRPASPSTYDGSRIRSIRRFFGVSVEEPSAAVIAAYVTPPLRRPPSGGSALLHRVDQDVGDLGPGELHRRTLAVAEHLADLRA